MSGDQAFDSQEQLVLDTLREKGELSGAELSRETWLGTGVLYPVLARLEACKAVSSRWATVDYPRKRVYRVG